MFLGQQKFLSGAKLDMTQNIKYRLAKMNLNMITAVETGHDRIIGGRNHVKPIFNSESSGH